VESVSGGSHWGGGMRTDSFAHARFGLLAARGGDWGGTRVVSRAWFDATTAPVAIAPWYAGMWWRPHADNPVLRKAPAAGFFALGSGGNLVWVHPARDLVLVARWVAFEQLDALVAQVEDAVTDA
ncbi:MAG: serine hydrolase, partial [Burkholderiales bacterium]|nr:serine hydrolase [Burkholderiales bacterium]